MTVWPLVNLHDVSLTHHSTNGVYRTPSCGSTLPAPSATSRFAGSRRRSIGPTWCSSSDARCSTSWRWGCSKPKRDSIWFRRRCSCPARPGRRSPEDKIERHLVRAALLPSVRPMFAVAIPFNLGAAERYAWTLGVALSVTCPPTAITSSRSRRASTRRRPSCTSMPRYDRAIAQYQERAGATRRASQGDRRRAAGAQDLGRRRRSTSATSRRSTSARVKALPTERGHHRGRPGVHLGAEQVARARHHLGAARGVRQHRRRTTSSTSTTAPTRTRTTT